MKLYYYKGACSLVARIILNELDIKFQDEAVDLRTKKTASGEDYLAINPKGAVPAIRLDNDDLITEVQVIAQYLADNTQGHKMLPSIGNINRYHTLEWLNYISTELHKTFGQFFNPAMTEEVKNKFLIPMIMAKFTFLNERLSKGTFLMGDEFTLPDAYLYVMVLWATFFKIDLSKFSHIKSYIERLQTRPSVIKSLEQEELTQIYK